MSPSRMKPPTVDDTPAVLRSKSTSIKKAKQSSTKTAQGPGTTVTACPAKRLANGLVDLTDPPQQILDIAKQNAAISPLIRLPAEIRNAIWKLAVGGHRVNPWKNDQVTGRQVKGGAFVAKDTLPSETRLDIHSSITEMTYARFCRHMELTMRAMQSDHLCTVRSMKNLQRALTAFHLPEVCRRIYADSATLAYSVNIFKLGRQDGTWINCLLRAQRDAMLSVDLSMYFATDMYSGKISCTSLQSTISSLRSRFPNLRQVHIADKAKEMVESSHLVAVGDMPRREVEKWHEHIVSLVKGKEGDDIEVLVEPAALKDDW
ncbi:hypothetical protein DE146DRAFT_776380 [Phaeosphaeria sp. MPI-PUGE-AT-0046c]|nr:hypothetical protein DE146DRAFT_776380 [Phaeosphaeria sp. MPI-PUGE-AT-0046c]